MTNPLSNQLKSLSDPSAKIPVGISACLMGQPVRFNGGHKQSKFCKDTLSEYFDFQSVCPEVGIGMSTPRQAIRLVSANSQDETVRAVGSDDATLDVTDALQDYAQQQAAKLSDLCGFIFMQKSPSCGLFGVKRYLPNGYSEGSTQGIFAGIFAKQNPLIPVEEAGRLNDAALRENFMTRVFAYSEWKKFAQTECYAAGLIQFHSRYKYLVMAHNPEKYREIGRLLANLKGVNLKHVADQYIALLMDALRKPASRKLHSNTLMHLQGYLKRLINSQDKQELSQCIDHYRQGVVPLVVPMTLLKHHFSHHQDSLSYIQGQAYLDPHPYQLGLRNSI